MRFLSSIETLELCWLVGLAGLGLVVAAWPRVSAGTHRRFSNVAVMVVNRFAVPLVTVPVLLWLQRTVPAWHGVAWLPVWAGFLVTLCLLDFAGYWFHRLSHRVPVLWRFHQIHHLDEDFDVTTGLRVHVGEEILHQLIAAVIVVAVAIPAPLYLTFQTLASLTAIFHHANVRLPAKLDRVLGWVIITPCMHGPHHHELIENTDSNYGFILPWWDRLFGTLNHTRRSADWRIGLDYAPDLNLLHLLVEPFRPTMLKDRLNRQAAAIESPAPLLRDVTVDA